MTPDIGELLAHGGWLLDDAQARHRAHPETFLLPTDEELGQIAVGSAVRARLYMLDLADPVRDKRPSYDERGVPSLVVASERLWFWVERVEGDELVGVLQNQPLSTHTRLRPAARVRIKRSDVIDLVPTPPVNMTEELQAMAADGFPPGEESEFLHPENPLRAPSIARSQADACQRAGTRPERPWDLSKVLIGKKVQPDTLPIYGVRARPVPERGDCGWVIWSGNSDMDSPATGGFEIIEVRTLRERSPKAWQRLALPPGWAFVCGADYENLYEEPSALE